MDEKKFNRLDRQMMKATRPLRERPVDPRLETGFAEEIEKRLERVPRRAGAPGWRAWLVPVPAAAVVVLSLVVVLRLPGSRVSEPIRPAPAQIQRTTAVTATALRPQPAIPAGMTAEQVAAEIDALRQLGVWSAEDEAALGDSEEILWEETQTA